MALFAGTGAAAGSASRQTDAKEIYSSFHIVAQKEPTTTRCGSYVVKRGRWTGRSTSPDRRLTGAVTMTGRLVMNEQGAGILTGRLTIRDRSRRIRMRGNVRAVVSRFMSVNGIVTGTLRRPNALLLANISLFFESKHVFAGVSLGLQSARNSAVAYSAVGKCG